MDCFRCGVVVQCSFCKEGSSQEELVEWQLDVFVCDEQFRLSNIKI